MKIRRGRPEDPQPFGMDQDCVKLKDCPDCNGRGWFLINPFATGGSGGAGGPRNMSQCLTCQDSKVYWDKHGKLPPEIVRDMKKKAKEADINHS